VVLHSWVKHSDNYAPVLVNITVTLELEVCAVLQSYLTSRPQHQRYIGIEKVTKSSRGGDYEKKLLQRECFWIYILSTLSPLGLNENFEWEVFWGFLFCFVFFCDSSRDLYLSYDFFCVCGCAQLRWSPLSIQSWLHSTLVLCLMKTLPFNISFGAVIFSVQIFHFFIWLYFTSSVF